MYGTLRQRSPRPREGGTPSRRLGWAWLFALAALAPSRYLAFALLERGLDVLFASVIVTSNEANSSQVAVCWWCVEEKFEVLLLLTNRHQKGKTKINKSRGRMVPLYA